MSTSFSLPTGQANRLLRIVVRFVLFLVLLNGLFYLEYKLSGKYLNDPYTHIVTLISGWIGKALLPFPVEIRGDFALGSGDAAVIIRNGCNGVEAVFLLLAGILAYPATLRQRLLAGVVYLPALFFLNVLRVLMLLYIFVFHPQYLDFFHFQVGQGILVVFVLVFWVHIVGWIDRTTISEDR